MLQKTTLKFLKDLSKNNHRDWFEANRKRYEDAKLDFLQLVQQVIKEFCSKDKNIGELEPKRCLFRINRDVRFSKDKSPYKTNLGASFEKGGRISPFACYYLHIEPGNKSFIAGGLWNPEADKIKTVRQEIDYGWDEFKKIIGNKKFISQFGDLERTKETSLSREPKGYEKDNPAIDYLKLKSWVVSTPISDEALTDKALLKKIVAAFSTVQPLIDFLNRGIEESLQ